MKYIIKPHVYTIDTPYTIRTNPKSKKGYNKRKNGDKVEYTLGYIYLPHEWISSPTVSLLLQPANDAETPIAELDVNGEMMNVYAINRADVGSHPIKKGYSQGCLIFPGTWCGLDVLVLMDSSNTQAS